MQRVFVDRAWREFHISGRSRDKYGVEGLLFATSGNALLANFSGARILAQKMNLERDLNQFPEQAVKAGQINAMGLLDEVLHHVVALYREDRNPLALTEALAWLDERIGAEAVDAALLRFTQEFPPLAVYQGENDAQEYLNGATAGTPNRNIALEEMLMLWLSNLNPALQSFGELFDDEALETEANYLPLMDELRAFFDTQPPFGPENQNLIDMLRAPALAAPDSLSAQLDFILRRWGVLAPAFLQRLLTSLDFIREEEKAIFYGPGPSIVPTYGPDATGRSGSLVGMDEPERFSEDRDWMPRAVIMAKNAYVWRDQLSKKYGRHIRTLDQVPDEELDSLARQGFTGLWLIGLWERSVASQRIKQMCGNEDAVASAYSLHDYEIAHELGGPDAMHNLRERAWYRGIRMASDMVPNHMAIDSRWVMEHPDWFLSLDYSPFPSYTFNGVDLSRDDRVGIYLEDHYYEKSDAAVVFKRVDRWSGSEKYVYHGNDGTSMPWNDTAQLNYLNPAVREAVIQTILHVARQFPIIRFDAAMTLAKRHYQRLWFPEPGTGGAIPSRAEHGLTAEQFNAAFPEEFWREVVDRVAAEAPDTLLLAEAFWMMEGYFVRTLGMHRVYNSAFMNMLREEENQKYRYTLKNTLEFDPDILKRFVNFMNNPDEKTAVEQFGKGGKYFGICTMMATLPGLPMFGHGQIEGFAEKYGMEYQRAYWDETPDADLIARHEREIFPLLKLRYIFAEVRDFLLYDFWSTGGSVNEDVFAYSNRHGDQRGLVIYHNKYAEAAGWIRTSVGALRKNGGDKEMVQQTLGEGLGLHAEAGYFTIFRDNVSGLEYIRHSGELCEKGLYVELGAYESHVFLNFREVQDVDGRYSQLAASLNGGGVPSIESALLELLLEPVHTPFVELLNADLLRRLTIIGKTKLQPPAKTTTKGATKVTTEAASQPATTDESLLDEVESRTRVLVRAMRDHSKSMNSGRLNNGSAKTKIQGTEESIAQAVRENVEAVLSFPMAADDKPTSYLHSRLDEPTWGVLLSWSIVRELGKAVTSNSTLSGLQSLGWLDEFLLNRRIADALCDLGLNRQEAERAVEVVKILTLFGARLPVQQEADLRKLTIALFTEEESRRYLGVNRYGDVWWFNSESFETLLWWILAANAVAKAAPSETVSGTAASTVSKTAASEEDATLSDLHDLVLKLQKTAHSTDFQVDRFLNLIDK